MDDQEVVRAFVEERAVSAFGPTLHVEGDALLFDGWWHTALRVSDDVFIVRNEEPPDGGVPALGELTGVLAARGLQKVGEDLPLILPVTYVALSLGQVPWALWAVDLVAGEQALIERAGAESFLGDAPRQDAAMDHNQVAGARRLAGLPPSVIVTVGLASTEAGRLQDALPDCHLETRTFEDTDPEACGALIPSLVVVEAGSQQGREFIMQLRASACGRFLPVAAVTAEPGVPLGADAALDPDQAPGGWLEPIRALLP